MLSWFSSFVSAAFIADSRGVCVEMRWCEVGGIREVVYLCAVVEMVLKEWFEVRGNGSFFEVKDFLV